LTGAAAAIGLAWAFLTPPFQVPDETSHVAYVQYLSESGRLPLEKPGLTPFSPEENALLGALGFARIIGRGTAERVIWTPASEMNLRRTEQQQEPARGQGNATTASTNPPLFYVMQAPVYLATSGGSLLTQLFAMRLLSVLFLSGSVLCAYLFVRELLPNSPWAWTAGGLAAAFQPMFGFIASGVNADSLLFLASTATLLVIARILRRGLTVQRAVTLSIAVAGGLLTKPLFIALLPAVVLGLILGASRLGRSATKPILTAIVVTALPVVFVATISATAYDHPYFAIASSVASGPPSNLDSSNSAAKEVSFILQLFVPRLPFMVDQIPGVPLRDLWISGLIGRFGWIDYGFGSEALTFGTWLAALLLALMAVAVARSNGAVRAAWPLLSCCMLALVSIPTVVSIVDYRAFVTNSERFAQARYLLPLLGLYAGLFALAVKALGGRVGFLATIGLWALVAFHTTAAMTLTANRYYL